MSCRWICIFLLLSLGIWTDAHAQFESDPNAAPMHRDTLDIFADQPHPLRSFIVQGSVRVYVSGEVVDTSDYRVDYRHGRLWLDVEPQRGDAILMVEYRTLPFSFADVYRRRHVDEESKSVVELPDAGPAQESQARVEETGFQLQHRGSISRGIRTGSHRDMNVDSGLRMEFAGQVADGLDVRGVLTDEQSPLQPDGSTQRLRDVDRVNLQVSSNQGRVELGDFDLALKGSHFAQLNRRVQGVMLESDAGGSYLPGDSELTVAAVANRGTYRQQDIQPLDGVQGPYQLQGSHGERFIVIMAGSERVYLDGQRLQRGDGYDYTIDYATGELWFTADHMITDERRITVEFEYATGEQQRTVVASQAQIVPWHDSEGNGRARIGATVLRASDGRRFWSGMNPDEALVPGADGMMLRSGAQAVPFDPEAPYAQYRSTQTAPGDSAFVPLDHAPGDNEPVYRVRFSHVGEGQGSYVRDNQAVNALRYIYRGEGLGSYSPVAPVPVPQQHQVVDVHGEVELFRGMQLFGEWAQSDRDQNRLLADPVHLDQGKAYRGGIRVDDQEIELGGNRLGTVSAVAQRHHQGRNFASFERTRSVEFGRRWNVPGAGPYAAGTTGLPSGETSDEFQARWAFSPGLHVGMDIGRLRLSDGFHSVRRSADAAVPIHGGGSAVYQLEHIASDHGSQAVQGHWMRHHGHAHSMFFGGVLRPGIAVEHEERLQWTPAGDSLRAPSVRFMDIRPQLELHPGSAWRLGMELAWRQEERVHQASLVPAFDSWTTHGTLRYDAGSDLDVDLRIGYRFREASRDAVEQDTRTLLTRSRTRYRPLDRAIDLSVQHEVRTERTPVMQELYLRTGPELGRYVWEDLNGDGIMQVDELIPERTPGEGMYARRMVPSDSLVPVTSMDARFRLHVDPYRMWRSQGSGWRHWLSHMESHSVLDVREQTRRSPSASFYLMDPRELQRSGETQRGSFRFSQDLIFLRRITGVDATVGYNRTQSLEDRTVDLESMRSGQWRAEVQGRIAGGWTFQVQGRLHRDTRASSEFVSRRYDIQGWHIVPRLGFDASTAWRGTMGLHYEERTDASARRSAHRISLPVQFRYARPGRTQITAEADVGHIHLKGDAAGLARFQMTDGRGAGTSARWNMIGRYQLTSSLQASFTYHGLAMQEAPVRNTFQVELTAQF